MSKENYLPADRKAIALAAFLFYVERGFHVELYQVEYGHELWLRVTREDDRELEPCRLLDHSFIKCEEVRVGYCDIVTTWLIPVDYERL